MFDPFKEETSFDVKAILKWMVGIVGVIAVMFVLLAGVVPMIMSGVDFSRGLNEGYAASFLTGEGRLVLAGAEPYQIPGTLYPSANDTWDIGRNTDYWRDLYVNGTIYGGTGRSATFVVAASNASAASIAQADYVCDGTADDVQIQAAIDALPTGGGCVVMTEGIFYFASSVIIPCDGGNTRLTLQGQGQATEITADGTLADHFFKTTVTTQRAMYHTFRDFVIDATLGGGSQSAGDGIYIWAPSYSRFINLTIRGCADDGIEMQGNVTWTSPDMVVRNCKINSNGGDGIYLAQYQSDVTITECNIFSNTNRAITAISGGNIITANRIYGNTGSALYLNGALNTVVGNYIAGNASAFISYNFNNVFVGNLIRSNTAAGLLGNNAIENVVVGNCFDNNGSPLSRDVTALGCVIRDNLGYLTEAYGNTTIPNGSTNVTITHGLSATPTHFNPRWTENPTNAPGDDWWTANATALVYNIENDPGASNLDLAWEALVR